LQCLWLLLVAIAALYAEDLHGESRENYLPNPGFEDGEKSWTFLPSPNADIRIDDAVSHSGKRSLRVEYHKHVDPRLTSYNLALDSVPAVLKAGQVYTVSGWIKIAGVPPGKTGPIAYFCEAHGERGCSPTISGNTDPAKNNGWVRVSFRYVPPPNDSLGHQFRCQCHSEANGMAGTVWFDDLKVEEGDQLTEFRPDWIDPTELYTREAEMSWFPMRLDYRSSLDVVTPHVEMAQQHAGGAPRVLWAGFYNNGRVGCELAERGDLTLDSVVFNGSSVDATPVRTLHQKCVDVFRARLGIDPKLAPDRSPQVLVIEQGIFELLNRQDRTAILDRIGQGMGCVVLLGPIHVRDHPGAVATPKIKDLIAAAEKLPQSGRGRVLTAMNIEQHPLWAHHGTLGIETAYSDALQAVYRSINGLPVDVRAAARPQPVANIPWTASVYGRGASVRIRIYRDLPTIYSSLMGGHGTSVPRSLVIEGEAKADADAAGTIRCPMASLPGGNYMMLAQSLDKQKQVLGWSLSPLSIASPVEITKLDAGTAVIVPRQPLQVACTLSNRRRPIRNARLITQIEDPRGRILSRSSSPLTVLLGESTLQLVVDLAHAESISVRLQVHVTADNLVLAERSLWLNSGQLMPRIDFHAGPYDDFNEAWSLMGADMVVGPPRPDIGLRPLPWLDLPSAIGENSSYCDPRVFGAAVKYVRSKLQDDDPWSVVGCILHDELYSIGFSSPPRPSDVQFFRGYLKEIYGDLKSLNASWGTTYRDWSEIDASIAKIHFATQSDRNPAPWADWQAASEQAAHRFYAALDQRVRQTHPMVRLGVSGTHDSNGVSGWDWWLLAQDFQYVALYCGVHNELYRSFAPKGRLMMNWSHLGGIAIENPELLRVRIWSDVLALCDGTPLYGGRFANVFYPDYRLKPGVLDYVAELAEIRNGIGRLILESRRNDAAAAIFYSPACYRARIVAMKDDDFYHAANEQNNLLASISTALADLRIACHFVSYEQVARGEVDPQKTKSLFLWGAIALSDMEAAAVRRYLEEGGIVIADSEPGLYDEHCHRRAVGPLRDCLPERSGIARQIGKGKFILCDDVGSGYRTVRGYIYEGAPDPTNVDEAHRTAAKLGATLKKTAALEGNFRLCDDRGRDFDCTMTAVDYVDGRARYVACLLPGKYGQTLSARLTIPVAGHLYNCRAGKYLGTTDGAAVHDVDLRIATGNFFALLPYRVERLDLVSPARAVLNQPIDVKATVVAAKSDKATFARHVVVFQLRRPDGRDLPEHRWIVETENGVASAQLYLALNDPAGKYTLIARDVATGSSQSATIEMQSAKAD
jgi:hypothetical protein